MRDSFSHLGLAGDFSLPWLLTVVFNLVLSRPACPAVAAGGVIRLFCHVVTRLKSRQAC